jgi:diguanylate cyclase (GGDEF)-like protein
MLKSGLHDQVFYETMWQDLIRQGSWRGEVWNRRKDCNVIAEILQIASVRDAAGQVSHYVGTFSDITDLKETQTRLERAASFDGLTGLPNRALLTDRLRQAQSHSRRRGTLLAIGFLDLDGFKPVNDHMGHEAGDRLLREVASRLEGAVRAGDTVARIGGDEFVLLLTDLHQKEEAAVTLERVLHHLASPYQIEGQRVQISASIGVTIYPHDDGDADTLLRHADQAMYRAKQEGRNRFHFFDTAQDEQIQLSAAQQQRLRQALANGEFRLHYQPKIDMGDGRLAGVEALVRWQHPERGLLPPAAFLPAIEHHDLICDLGEWVLGEALRQRDEWAAQGLALTVSVNIGARHFLKPDFVPRLKALLGQHPDLPAGALELEIVETAAFDDLEAMVDVVLGCRALGVRFALDDFGTGYSSLTYLKLLPADVLKIDRSFVFEMLLDKEALAIVEGIVSLARAFQHDIIAEGVETVEHGTLLLRLGCRLAQGYGIARPMPGDELAAWAARYALPAEWAAWAELDNAGKDFPLLVAEVSHRHWVESVIAATAGEGLALDRAEITELDECGFGHWVERHGREHYGRHPDFGRVEDLHRQLHQSAHHILDLLDDGREREARKLVKALRIASDELLGALAGMQLDRASSPRR